MSEPTYEELLASWRKERTLQESGTRLRRRKRTVMNRWTKALIIGVVVMSIPVGALALTAIFTQNVPSITTSPPVLVSNCGSVTLTSTLPPQNSTGFVTFGCSPTKDAFKQNTAGTAVALFNLVNSGYTDLWMYNGTQGGNPASCLGIGSTHVNLTATPSVNFATGSIGWGFSYCLDFTHAPVTLGSFSVTWEDP